MITPPSRSYPVVDKKGSPSERFTAWAEQISIAVNNAAHPGFSLVLEPSRGSATLNYTNGVLTQVVYADTSTKNFIYTSGILTEVQDSSGPNLTFNFNSGVLESIG
ncbi:MAG: hypothetical protein ACRBCS_03175 [Cellvibrionaceae bacterium]